MLEFDSLDLAKSELVFEGRTEKEGRDCCRLLKVNWLFDWISNRERALLADVN